MKESIYYVLMVCIVASALLLFIFVRPDESIYHPLLSPPDKSCIVDSDCTLRPTSCDACDCGEAVNRNWEAVCPFSNKELVHCKICPSEGDNFEIQCVENLCQKVWLDQ